jgi:hypothetical protein
MLLVTLREFNNSHVQSLKLQYQVEDLVRRVKEKDIPSFIIANISVPVFRFDLNTTEAAKNAFMDKQRHEVERFQLNILKDVFVEKQNVVASYQSSCNPAEVLKSLLKQLLDNAYDMQVTESFQDEYADQCVLAMNYVHCHIEASTHKAQWKMVPDDWIKKEKAIASKALIDIDHTSAVTETIEQLVHKTVRSLLEKYNRTNKTFAPISKDRTTDHAKKRTKDPTKDRTKPNPIPSGKSSGKGQRPMRKGQNMSRVSHGLPYATKSLFCSHQRPLQTIISVPSVTSDSVSACEASFKDIVIME